ncbi:hypothetical protein Q4595_10890 [Wenyingzhuangia sp. 1_MG-2023]|nr:hypothetical protein [Wenyingzhuangia sp. 1_MG-2023]
MKKDSIINNLKLVNESLIKKIDSLNIQNQIDNLTYKIENQNSITNEINSFYDSAWLKLIFMITIIGIIVPLVIQYFQRKNFNEIINNIKEKFDDKINTLKDSNDIKINSIIEKYEESITELEDKNEKALIELDANTFYLQARTLFTEKKFKNTISSSLKAALLLKRYGRLDRIIPTLNVVIRTLGHINEVDSKLVNAYLLNNSEKKDFEQTLIELEMNLNEDSIIHLKIQELRKIIQEKNIT